MSDAKKKIGNLDNPVNTQNARTAISKPAWPSSSMQAFAHLFANPWLWGAVALSAVLQVAGPAWCFGTANCASWSGARGADEVTPELPSHSQRANTAPRTAR